MHWDFFTLLSVFSGIVLIAASLAGPVMGPARERLSIFAVGAFSFAYGIWVATQTSGFFMFSVAPAGLAAIIIIRAVQHAGQKKPERIRQAVLGQTTAFCPPFQLPGSAEVSAPGNGADYYLSESLALGWSVVDGKPRLPRGEELFGLWQVNARVKVAVGPDLNPTTPRPGVSWVTVLDGTGLIALSRHRVIGVVVRGDSLLGVFDGGGSTGIALWCLPLRRFSSVSVAAVGHGEGLVLSSAEPAGHVTLTGISTAEAPGRRAFAVPPGHVAEMINRARAEVSSRIG